MQTGVFCRVNVVYECVVEVDDVLEVGKGRVMMLIVIKMTSI